ncbi:MAG: competence protein CoiA family protein [Candidatus Eremiobacteraeota bacterium]|nr:competence protein CoiA family protein [Candidatus Eremiobacteraeota bacterium]
MEKKTFKIPYGVDEKVGELIKACDALKSNNYYCPSCHSDLVFRQGKVRAPHFAHKIIANCSEETVMHKIAKLLIVEAVSNWKEGKGPRPKIRRLCPKSYCSGFKDQELPEKVVSASEEFGLPNGRVVDVALMEESSVAAAVEIYYSHKVDAQKASEFEHPWFEVDALKILENPLLWECRQDSLKPFKCPDCLARENEIKEKRDALIKEVQSFTEHYQIKLPPSPPYYWSIKNCYRCDKRTLVYKWQGHSLWQTKLPPKPIPPSVKFKYSHTTRSKYWVNTCRFCGAIQGDFHLDDGIDFWLPSNPYHCE